MKILAWSFATILNILVLPFPKLAGRLAFRLFCFPPKITPSARQQAFISSGRQEDLDAMGKRVATYRWGNGPKKILLVHGWGSHAGRWRKMAEILDPNTFTLYAFDAPGHGNSEGRFANALLFAASVKAIIQREGPMHTIIGHSVGSFATIYFLHSESHTRLEKFVSLAAPSKAAGFMSTFRQMVPISDRTSKYLLRHFKEYAGQPFEYFDTDNFLDDMKFNTLIIHDEKDKDVDVQNAHRIHARISRSKLLLTQGLGHGLQDAEVYEAVREFISS